MAGVYVDVPPGYHPIHGVGQPGLLVQSPGEVPLVVALGLVPPPPPFPGTVDMPEGPTPPSPGTRLDIHTNIN